MLSLLTSLLIDFAGQFKFQSNFGKSQQNAVNQGGGLCITHFWTVDYPSKQGVALS